MQRNQMCSEMPCRYGDGNVLVEHYVLKSLKLKQKHFYKRSFPNSVQGQFHNNLVVDLFGPVVTLYLNIIFIATV